MVDKTTQKCALVQLALVPFLLLGLSLLYIGGHLSYVDYFAPSLLLCICGATITFTCLWPEKDEVDGKNS